MSTIDLTRAGATREYRVPKLHSSSSGARDATPGSRLPVGSGSRTNTGSRTADPARTRSSSTNNTRSTITRESILSRYRARPTSADSTGKIGSKSGSGERGVRGSNDLRVSGSDKTRSSSSDSNKSRRADPVGKGPGLRMRSREDYGVTKSSTPRTRAGSQETPSSRSRTNPISGGTPETRESRKERIANARKGKKLEDRIANARKGMKDLPSKDIERMKNLRAKSQVLSSVSNLSMAVATSAIIGFSGGSYSSGWYYGGYGYDHGHDSWWWYTSGCYTGGWGQGSHWGWPGYGHGFSWGLGWSLGWCWSTYWQGCYSYGYWYRPHYGYYYPPSYYSVAVYDHYDDRYYDDPQVIYIDREVVYVDGAEVEAVNQAGAPSVAAPGSSSASIQIELSRAADYYLVLGDRAFRDERFGDAVHFYAKAVEFAEDNGVMYLILSDALFATGDYHYAAYALRKALELDETLTAEVVDKHSFYTDPARFDSQVGLLERYLADHFLDDDARLVLAANYLFGGQPEAAVELLESAFSSSVTSTVAGQRLLVAAQRRVSED